MGVVNLGFRCLLLGAFSLRGFVAPAITCLLISSPKLKGGGHRPASGLQRTALEIKAGPVAFVLGVGGGP